MKISAEISLYPLAELYRPVIQNFLDRLQRHTDLEVHVNTMSTQVFGDYRRVMQVITDELEHVYREVPSQVLVCKFINRDLSPDE